MKRVMTVLGTRPEAIKLAPVIDELARHSETVESKVVITSQHRELVAPMLELFGIVADHDLDIMEPAQTPSLVTSRVLAAIGDIYREQRPDLVLVQGDTTSAMAAALAA